MRTQTIIFGSSTNSKITGMSQWDENLPSLPNILLYLLLFVLLVLRLRRILILNSCVLPISITFEIQMLSSVRNKEDQQRLKVSSHIRYFFTNLELKTFLSGQEHKERIIHASRRMDEVVDEHEHSLSGKHSF